MLSTESDRQSEILSTSATDTWISTPPAVGDRIGRKGGNRTVEADRCGILERSSAGVTGYAHSVVRAAHCSRGMKVLISCSHRLTWKQEGSENENRKQRRHGQKVRVGGRKWGRGL